MAWGSHKDSENRIAALRLILMSGILNPGEDRMVGSAVFPPERWRCALLPPVYSHAPNAFNHPLISPKSALPSLKPAGERVSPTPFFFLPRGELLSHLKIQ